MAEHDATVVFTRNVVGSMDYTPVTFSNKIRQGKEAFRQTSAGIEDALGGVVAAKSVVTERHVITALEFRRSGIECEVAGERHGGCGQQRIEAAAFHDRRTFQRSDRSFRFEWIKVVFHVVFLMGWDFI